MKLIVFFSSVSCQRDELKRNSMLRMKQFELAKVVAAKKERDLACSSLDLLITIHKHEVVASR